MRAFLGGRVPRASGADATALLADQGRIVAVGTDEEIRSRLSAGAECVDLRGGMLLPAFQDAHLHLCQLGRYLSRPNLGACASLDEALREVSAALRRPGRGVLFAEGFDQSRWPEARFPTRTELDRLEKDRPVVVRRVCGHIAVANEGALRRIPEGTPHVNRTSGLLEEEAVFRLESDFFPPSGGEIADAIARAEEEAFSFGITTVHEIDTPAVCRGYEALDREGKLRMRTFFYVYAPVEEADRLRRSSGRGNFRVAGAKVFLDGSVGGKTAALSEPYAGGGEGVLLVEREEITRILEEAESAGLAVAFHGIGDRAVDELVAVYEERFLPAPTSLLHRIEHAELLSEGTAERIRRLGLRLCMQPNFPARWGGEGGMYEERVGPERAKRMNRIGSWVRRGIPVAFGSDGMPMDPFYGLRGAMEHPAPEERLSFADAIRCYTSSAESFVEGGGAGELRAGKRADFIELDRDPRSEAPLVREELRRTVAAGEIVYERG